MALHSHGRVTVAFPHAWAAVSCALFCALCLGCDDDGPTGAGGGGGSFLDGSVDGSPGDGGVIGGDIDVAWGVSADPSLLLEEVTLVLDRLEAQNDRGESFAAVRVISAPLDLVGGAAQRIEGAIPATYGALRLVGTTASGADALTIRTGLDGFALTVRVRRFDPITLRCEAEEGVFLPLDGRLAIEATLDLDLLMSVLTLEGFWPPLLPLEPLVIDEDTNLDAYEHVLESLPGLLSMGCAAQP